MNVTTTHTHPPERRGHAGPGLSGLGRRALRAATLAALAVGVAGCMEYTFDTTVRPDGGGVRVERIEVERNSDFEPGADRLRALLELERAGPWETTTQVEEDGDTVWVLERRSPVDRLAEWPGAVERTLIRGATPENADRRLGYVRLGDVNLRNSVQVGVTRQSDGTSTIRYREAFVWDQAADALVEFFLRDLDDELAARYPKLTPAERGSILGYARARLAVAGEEGLFSGDEGDELAVRAVEHTVEDALKVIRVRHPEADGGALRSMLGAMLLLEDGDEEAAEQRFLELLPGLNLGFNTSIVFRLTLPGTVTSTNADDRHGNTLEWKFGPLDDVTKTVEVFAESVVGG